MCVAKNASVEINLTVGYGILGPSISVSCRCGGEGGLSVNFVPIYDITSDFEVAVLFWREATRWTPDAIWFLRYFSLQAYGTLYLECRECWEGIWLAFQANVMTKQRRFSIRIMVLENCLTLWSKNAVMGHLRCCSLGTGHHNTSIGGVSLISQ